MDATSILMLLVWMLGIYWVLGLVFKFGSGRQQKLPPGPYGIPLLGYIPFLGRQSHLKFTELGKRYGSIFSLKMGEYLAIVLHDWSAVKAALIDQGDVFAGRTQLAFSKEIVKGPYGIISTDGDIWKLHRRFALSKLRDFGFGRRSLADSIKNETRELCLTIDEIGEQGIEMKTVLFVPLLNVTWRLVAGKQFDQNDPSMARVKDIVTELTSLSGIHYYSFMSKFLQRLTRFGQTEMKRRKEVFYELKDLMRKEIEEHHKKLNKDDPADLIDMYLIEMENQQSSQNKEADDRNRFSENHLISMAENFFLAGVETSTSTLSWGIHFLVTWPHVQDKIHQEMDKVLGRGRSPMPEDRDLLPYTNAALMEIQRYASIVPLAISHRCMKDTTLLGYHVPQNTTIIPNLWHVSKDPALWGDPENFRPERFLNENGKIVKPEYFVPFSLGARVCLGESLAKMELFIFFSNLLHRFHFECPPGAEKPNLNANFGLTLTPPTYMVIAKKRL